MFRKIQIWFESKWVEHKYNQRKHFSWKTEDGVRWACKVDGYGRTHTVAFKVHDPSYKPDPDDIIPISAWVNAACIAAIAQLLGGIAVLIILAIQDF